MIKGLDELTDEMVEGKVTFVAQTTMEISEFNKIAEVIKKKNPDAVIDKFSVRKNDRLR